MSEERKGNGNIRFNLLDIALIALALLCVVSVWQRSNLKKIFEESGVYQSYTVYFSATEVSQGVVDALTAGTTLYVENEGTRCLLGTLNDSVTVDKRSTWSFDISGAVTCMILQKDGHYFLKNGPQIALNQRFFAQSETAILDLVVVSIAKSN